MDKMPVGLDLWAPSLAWGLVCLVAGRIQPWLGLLFLALSLSGSSWGVLADLQSASIGPALRQEAGTGFVAQAVAASTVAPVAWVVGIRFWQRRRRGSTSQA